MKLIYLVEVKLHPCEGWEQWGGECHDIGEANKLYEICRDKTKRIVQLIKLSTPSQSHPTPTSESKQL